MREQYDRKSKGDNVRIAQLEKQTADLQDKLTALTRGKGFECPQSVVASQDSTPLTPHRLPRPTLHAKR